MDDAQPEGLQTNWDIHLGSRFAGCELKKMEDRAQVDAQAKKRQKRRKK